MPDDHSKVVPLLPIPNRTVKRLSADDSADSRVKVGHRQALTARNAQLIFDQLGVFFCARKIPNTVDLYGSDFIKTPRVRQFTRVRQLSA